MDKNKSEKLKQILNQTISQEEIEEKLKKEIKASALKKAKEEKIEKEALEINSEIQIKEEPYQEKEIKIERKITQELNKADDINKKVIIPSIRDKKKENRDINILLYLVGTIALLLFLVVIYLFINKEDFEKSTTSIGESKTSTEKVYDEKVIQDNKELKNDIESKEPLIKVIETNEKIKVEEEIDTKPKETVKEIIKEVVKEKIVTKIVKLEKENFKTYYNSSNFNTLKCYNFKAGDIFPTSACKKNLSKFLKENKNAIRFEVIPVIAQNDNIIFDKMQSNMKSMDKAFQDRVKEYMYRGLSRERVLETTWYIKDVLGEDTILTPTNYYVKSKKNNKGIIVKAYH